MLPRVPKKVLYLYRRIILNHSDPALAYAEGYDNTHQRVRKTLEPLCYYTTPQELDRAIDEAEKFLAKTPTFVQNDPQLFKYGLGSPYFSYFEAPLMPTHDMSVKTPLASRANRFYFKGVWVVNVPPLPIKNKSVWLKKWKENPPEIPI